MLSFLQIAFAAFSLAAGTLISLRPLSPPGAGARVWKITGYWLFGLYIAAVLILTIFSEGLPGLGSYRFLNLEPFIWVRETCAMGFEALRIQMLLHIVMFIPLGFLLPALFRAMRFFPAAALVFLAAAVGTESVQYFIGRSCDIDDALMSFLGGVLGFGAFCLLRVLWRRRAARLCPAQGKT